MKSNPIECSIKKVILNISKDSQQKNTCARLWHRHFPVNFAKLLSLHNTSLLETASVQLRKNHRILKKIRKTNILSQLSKATRFRYGVGKL